MAPTESKKEKSSVTTYLSHLGTAFITFLFALAYQDFTAKEPKLLYEVLEYAVFKSETKKLGIYVVQI